MLQMHIESYLKQQNIIVGLFFGLICIDLWNCKRYTYEISYVPSFGSIVNQFYLSSTDYNTCTITYLRAERSSFYCAHSALLFISLTPQILKRLFVKRAKHNIIYCILFWILQSGGGALSRWARPLSLCSPNKRCFLCSVTD